MMFIPDERLDEDPGVTEIARKHAKAIDYQLGCCSCDSHKRILALHVQAAIDEAIKEGAYAQSAFDKLAEVTRQRDRLLAAVRAVYNRATCSPHQCAVSAEWLKQITEEAIAECEEEQP